MKKFWKTTLLILFFIAIDFLTKTYVLYMCDTSIFPLEFYGDYKYIYPSTALLKTVSPFFDIFLVWNKGISFSMFSSNSQLVRWGLVIFASLIVIYLLLILRKEKNNFIRLSLILIIAGALGNIIDRIRYGAVVDFLDFHYNTYHWPAFNFADVFICVGVGLILIHSIFFHKKS